MNICQFDVLCCKPCEGNTNYCGTHNRLMRKAEETAKRDADKLAAKLLTVKENNTKPKASVRKVSEKQKIKNQEYSERVKEWKKENPKCKANCNEYCTNETDDCQHLRGRGKYLMDETTWMPVCRSCHTYIGDHSKEAYEKGWALSRLEVIPKEPHAI